jgi:hypothetical protein
MENIELTTDEYAADHSVAKLFPDAEKRLANALASGKEFCAAWECGRAPTYGGVCRRERDVIVNVAADFDGLDEDGEILSDMWERFAPEGSLSAAQALPYLLCAARNGGVQGVVREGKVLPGSATLQEVLDALGNLESQVNCLLHLQYVQLEEFVKLYAGAAARMEGGASNA